MGMVFFLLAGPDGNLSDYRSAEQAKVVSPLTSSRAEIASTAVPDPLQLPGQALFDPR